MAIVLTKNLAEQIDKSEIESLASRLKALQQMKGNPMDAAMKKFGDCTAFTVKNIPGPAFNLVKGFNENDLNEFKEILAFYNYKEIPCRFEITPAQASLPLFRTLSRNGFSQSSFHSVLYSSCLEACNKEAEVNSQLSIRLLKEHEFDIFAEIYTQGFGMPAFLKDSIAANNKVLHRNEHWFFYLATLGDVPAGIGVLFTKGRTAVLAASATLPQLRNKGIHSALIQKRVQTARQLNCGLITGQARFGSVSQNNMERAGLKLAYTKSVFEEI